MSAIPFRLIGILAPFGGQDGVLRHLKQNLFKDQPLMALRPGENGQGFVAGEVRVGGRSLKTVAVAACIVAIASVSGGLVVPKKSFADEEAKKAQIDGLGRDIRSISINKNEDRLLYIECFIRRDMAKCYVYELNLITKKLSRLLPDDDYIYTTARYSPSGKYIVMSRIPNAVASSQAIRNSFERGEIIISDNDGKNIKIISNEPGVKDSPFVSIDDKKVAYWRSLLRVDGSRSLASNHDLYEIELSSGAEHIFAGKFSFFEHGNSQYIDDNNIIANAYGPSQYGGAFYEYFKRTNNSSIYKIGRGDAELQDPICTEVEYASNPTLDRNGALYFQCQIPSKGIFLCKSEEAQIKRKWEIIRDIQVREIQSSSSGKTVYFVTTVPYTQYRERRSQIISLNTETGEWVRVDLPSIESERK